MSSSTVICPSGVPSLPVTSPARQADTLVLPSEMFTINRSSLIVTWLLPSQSPAQDGTVGPAVWVVVGAAVSVAVLVGVPAAVFVGTRVRVGVWPVGVLVWVGVGVIVAAGVCALPL